MSNDNHFYSSSYALATLCAAALFLPLQAVAADRACQSFLLQGAQLVVDAPAGVLQSGSLPSLIASLEGDGEQLAVDFATSQLCVEPSQSELTSKDSVPFVINAQAQELAVQATIAGGKQVWLRISPDYQSELLLDRTVGEEIGLTDMEFLSDNSGVGAEDFFAEPIDDLELGSLTVQAPFADVPRYGVDYAHYPETVNQAAQGFVATQGILGLASLRSLTLRFSPSQGLVLFTK
jgi:hypothetical protein